MKENLKSLLKKLNFNIEGTTTQDEFIEKLNQDEWFKALDQNMKISTFSYCVSKAKSKDKDFKKKDKKSK